MSDQHAYEQMLKAWDRKLAAVSQQPRIPLLDGVLRNQLAAFANLFDDNRDLVVEDTYGFDCCINYKQADWKDQIASEFPDGISYYHDNVGGELLDTALLNLADYDRVVLCGLASQYQLPDNQRPAGPNPGIYIVKRAKVMGLVVYDFLPEMEQYAAQAKKCIDEGRLRFVEDTANDLEATPALFEKLMKGENIGKTLIRVQAAS